MSQSNIFKIKTVSQLKSLKVACILDEFSFETFCNECILKQLTPDDWNTELTEFTPDLLLVESAWRGKDDLWKHKLLAKSSLLVSIIAWCNERKIPTVFWNKEDPVNFENFTFGMGISQLFDYVFTTDIDSISRYKKILKHDRIYLLPFTFQPSMHNPIEEYEREDAVCFAGSYYRKYPKRSQDFKTIYDSIISDKPVVIYDRNHSRGDPQFQYPEHYHTSIKGFLPFSEIGKGYKGYEYGLTMNSVTQSQTMFARRALELIACNTSIISNYSRSLRLFFGDGVIMLGDKGSFKKELKNLFQNEAERKRVRYHLLQHVFKEFTAKRGLQLIVDCVTGQQLGVETKSICCIAKITSEESLSDLFRNFARQQYQNKTLVVIGDSSNSTKVKAPANTIFYSNQEWSDSTTKSLLAQYDYFAKFGEQDYYGANYLSDSITAQDFAAGAITCREPHYQLADGKISLSKETKSYQWCSEFVSSSAVFPKDTLSASKLEEVLNKDLFKVTDQQALSLDLFNYCRFGARDEDKLAEIDPGEYPQLITLDELHQMALQITSEVKEIFEEVKITGPEILKTFSQQRAELVTDLTSIPPLRIISNLEPDKHTYINSDTYFDIEKFRKDDLLRFRLDCSYDFDLLLDVYYYDAAGKEIIRYLALPNSIIHHVPQEGVVTVKFALRIKGPGTAELNDLITGERFFIPQAIRNLSDNLHVIEKKDLPLGSVPVDTDIFVYSEDLDFEYIKIKTCDAIAGGDLLFRSLMKGSTYKKISFSNAELENKIRSKHSIKK